MVRTMNIDESLLSDLIIGEVLSLDKKRNIQEVCGEFISKLLYITRTCIHIFTPSVFSTRQHMLSALYAIACPSVHPSICLSVRHTGGSVKTVEVRIMQFSPYSSPIPLVFAIQVSQSSHPSYKSYIFEKVLYCPIF